MTTLAHVNSAYLALSNMLSANGVSLVLENYLSTYQLERSKSQDYVWLTNLGVPIPPSDLWDDTRTLVDLITTKLPCVVKQDTGKTLGIQTTVVKSIKDLPHVIKSLQYSTNRSGIVQQYIGGQELTVTVLVGDQNWSLIGAARDYKKQFENNQGLNTFGLGSTNLNQVPSNILELVDQLVICYRQKYQYRGFLSCQFITNNAQQVWLLECNTRLCDPEFQSMAINLPNNIEHFVTQALTGETISNYQLGSSNSVTIGLVNQDWPDLQLTRADLDLSDCPFVFLPNRHTGDNNCYLGSITNSGTDSHKTLATQIYQYLATVQVAPYRYRTDIAQQ